MKLKYFVIALLLSSYLIQAQVQFVTARNQIRLEHWTFKKGNIYDARNINLSTVDWNSGGIPFTNHKGLVTYDRTIKKDAFYSYRANWSVTPVMYIAEWRHDKREHALVKVKIYTNQDHATLYVNDRKIAKKKLTSDIKIIAFEDIELKKGENRIEVRSGKSMTDEVIWHLD